MKKRKILLSITSVILATVTASFMVAAEDSPKRDGWENTNEVLNDIEEDSNFKLKAEYKDGKYVDLGWGRDGEENETGREYSVYSKILDGIEGSNNEYYRPVPIEGTVNVLNIYPGNDKQNPENSTSRLEKWMKEPALEKVVDQENGKYDTEVHLENNITIKYKYIRNKNKEVISNGGGVLESQTDSSGNVTFIKDSDGYNKLMDVPERDENGLYVLDDETATKYNLPKINVKAMDLDEFEKKVALYEAAREKGNLTEEKLEENNPLKKNGEYIYDVIMFGAWDCNNEKIPSNKAVSLFKNFITNGGGFLSGHDNMTFSEKEGNGLGILRKKFNILVSNPSQDRADSDLVGKKYGIGGDKVRIKKGGMLTYYPWKIGDEKTKLDIPYSHSTNNYAYGCIWMDYGDLEPNGTAKVRDGSTPVKEEYAKHANFYLTTNKNTAMIQTGHALVYMQDSSPDEKKVLANTLSYLHQLTAKKSMKDYSVQDITPPDEPNINYVALQDKANISINPVNDKGTKYSYVVKEHNLHYNKYFKSNSSEITATSGVKSYLVYVDDKEDTDITTYIKSDKYKTDKRDKKDETDEEKKLREIDDNKDRNIDNLARMGIKVVEGKDINGDEIKCDLGEIKDNKYIKKATEDSNYNCYVHVAAMDNNNNISDTSHKKVSFSNILDVESEKDSVIKNNEAWTDISLNNINEENKSFSIHNVNDILSQKIVINYDPKKLKYRGMCTLNRPFTIFDEIVDENLGTITLNMRCRNIPDLKRNYMISLNFDTIETGNAEVSIKEGTISDMSKEYVLLPVQLGKCSIEIK